MLITCFAQKGFSVGTAVPQPMPKTFLPATLVMNTQPELGPMGSIYLAGPLVTGEGVNGFKLREDRFRIDKRQTCFT